MTIKKLMMAAGAIDGPQVIAPSSNDWDYTFSQSEWPCAGNTLGDGTVGGFTTVSGGDSGISSLPTFDGAFDIEFDLTAGNNTCFGVHAIDEDDTRAISSRGDMHSMTNSFYWREAPTATAYIGSSSEGTVTIADGSAIKLSRDASGTITLTDDGSVVKTFSSTYTGTVRFWIGAEGTSTPNFDNIFFTDTEKVQRDGFFNETDTGGVFTSGASRVADRDNCGNTWRATRTGNITGAKVSVHSVATSGDYWIEIWSDDGTNPVAQIGGDSDTLTISSSGVKEYTFATPVPIVKGTTYWFVIANTTTGEVQWDTVSNASFPGGGRFDRDATITSLGDIVAYDLMFEVVVDTSTGEPTPDHETLLLISSNASDSSQTFVDSSQFGRTITVVADTQHDTAQKKFGASSILFDGTGDYLTAVDSSDWYFRGKGNGATVDFWLRTSSNSRGVIGHNSGDPVNNWELYVNGAGKITALAYGNGSAGSINTTTSTTISDGAWHHITYSWDSVTTKIAVNGTWEASSSTANPFQDVSATLKIGYAVSAGSGATFNGHLDEIRISSVARWDHSANFTPPTSPYP